MANFVPSVQQAAFFNWIDSGSGSAMLEAVAGSGKTTTLLQALPRTSGTVAFVAFGKKIAEEIKARIARDGLDPQGRITASTVHALGLQIYRNHYPRAKVDDKKLWNLATATPDGKDQLIPMHSIAFAMRAVNMAKQAGIGATIDASDRDAWYRLVDHYSLDQYLSEENGTTLEDALRYACILLKASNDCTNAIDFNDMIYLPVRMKLASKFRYDWIFLDECQDTNAMRLELISRVSHENTRVVAVGDSRQAIFGFAGADSDSVAAITKRFNCVSLPLTVSYRCPQAVVREAQQWVSHIQAHETAPEGQVSHCDMTTFWDNIFPTLGAEDFVICRNTAPIVKLAYAMLAKGKACMVEGRDIGTGLVKLATKWKRVKTIAALRAKVEEWRSREMERAEKKGNDSRKASVIDQAECLLIIMAQFADDDKVERVRDSIQAMFGDTPEGARPIVLTLSTIHKSKGREARRVLWLGRNAYNPSRYARKDWEMLQEANLMYVAATRAKETLIYVNVDAD